jgi:hypothetical protein
MNIRLMGLPAEIEPVLTQIQDIRTVDVIHVDGPYPNRGTSRLVRACIQARLRADGRADP